MDNIVEPNKSFDFTQLSLAHPSGIQGGAYFTRILYNDKPLYIQTSKCLTKQGFVKSGKKYYCDLMFDNNAEILIQWFENLEEKCQALLLSKNEAWFQNSLTLNDIEGAFNSAIRVYKSGKYYLVRTNIKCNLANEPNLKIYNENEITIGMSDITNETNVVTILEIQGIRFTSRSFQIEIDLKQVMVVENEPIFDSCLIKTNKVKHNPITLEKEKETCFINDNLLQIEDGKDTLMTNIDDIVENEIKKEENITIELDIEDLNTQEETNVKELSEVTDIVLDESLETIPLKKPNEVYFELYKEARNKAKLAKKSAIIAYLEAKNIKKTYMLENINDSDSDFDAEIDEVSESELDRL
jgi:hypothetical protein